MTLVIFDLNGTLLDPGKQLPGDGHPRRRALAQIEEAAGAPA